MGYSFQINEENKPPFTIPLQKLRVSANSKLVHAIGKDAIDEAIMVTCARGDVGLYPPELKVHTEELARTGNKFIAVHPIQAQHPDPNNPQRWIVRCNLIFVPLRKENGDDRDGYDIHAEPDGNVARRYQEILLDGLRITLNDIENSEEPPTEGGGN